MLVTRRIGSDGATDHGAGERRYVGELDSFGRRVWVEEGGVRRALPYRGEGLPVTFVWSRVGIGARELARSILLDATDNPALAERFCRELTHEVIAALPILGFRLDRADVLTWLAR
jgi:hypothetical protein